MTESDAIKFLEGCSVRNLPIIVYVYVSYNVIVYIQLVS